MWRARNETFCCGTFDGERWVRKSFVDSSRLMSRILESEGVQCVGGELGFLACAYFSAGAGRCCKEASGKAILYITVHQVQ